jgi:DNA-directed RNA polymerase beta' subunit
MADIHNEMEMEEIICLFEMIDTEKKENDAENLAKERRNRERELRNKEIREAVAQGRIVTNVKEDMEPLTKSTVDLLGINPLDLIMCAVQVIPPCYRTTTTYESAFDSDFLGNRYNNIIRYNEELDPQKRILVEDSKQTSLTRVRRNLYDEIKLLYDNPKSKDGDNKRNPPGIKQALKSKEGQYRNNMEGKRVDNAARTVVSPDPMLRFGQVGVPLAIAKVVNVPVTVTSTNQPELMALLQAGRVNYVYRGDLKDNRIKVEIGDHNRESYVLKPGDKVLRWLQNGDYVLAGRQPTLHIQSLMGHEVVIHNDLTLKFGLFETSPYNMDFDGDEATIYVPLTEEGFAELQGTKNVINNIIDPETGKPAMAAVMDVLTAAYRLTQKRKPLSESQWNDLVMYLLPETFYETIPTLTERLHRHGVERFTGRALISAMFPPDFYYKGMIVDGIYKMGSMGKDDIGRSHGGIVQKMWRKYPHQRLANLFTDLSHVLNVWQQSDPLSLGLQDMPQTDELNRAKNMEVAKVRAVASQTGGGQLDDPIEKNRREQQMTIYVNELESRGKEYVKPILGDNNAFIIMGSEGSGAKGGILNILQTSFVVGPQNLFGKRLPKVMRNGTVCLPYFDSDDTSPDSRGFCENSYLTGLSPAEWFFTHWAGREGLVNTAITTAKTGYLGRLLHNLTEDLITRQDGTVRNANNEIVQLNYSVDGFSPMMVSPMKILPDGEKVRWFIDIQDEAKEINAAFGFY